MTNKIISVHAVMCPLNNELVTTYTCWNCKYYDRTTYDIPIGGVSKILHVVCNFANDKEKNEEQQNEK